MTHTVLARIATVGMVSAAFLMMAPQSNGQTPRYRLTPLIRLGFTPQADLHGTLGINDDGWIITWGVDTFGTTGTHAILFTPFPQCPIDIDHDGCVDINDFLAVINNWGSCPVGSICHADTDGNCAVDVDDLLNANNATVGMSCVWRFVRGRRQPANAGGGDRHRLDANIPEATKAEIISELVNNWN